MYLSDRKGSWTAGTCRGFRWDPGVIAYTNARGEPRQRRTAPYRQVAHHLRWYLCTWDDSADWRVYESIVPPTPRRQQLADEDHPVARVMGGRDWHAHAVTDRPSSCTSPSMSGPEGASWSPIDAVADAVAARTTSC